MKNAKKKCLKHKACVPNMQSFAGKDFICCGYNKKPKKYKHDVIKLCLQGKYINDFCIEMTPSEALDISACITATLANIAQS